MGKIIMNHIKIGILRYASLIFIILLSSPLSAQDEYAYPKGCGWVVVTEHGAVPDGKADNTNALRSLPFKNKHAMGTMFFPNGTYLVKDQIFIGGDKFKSANKRLTLQGESRGKTIIKLEDNSPGYQDPNKPRAVITFHKDSGTTGQSFGNSVYNLTVDVGKGNPGAIALSYVNNNHGCIRNVTLRSSDPEGAGKAGLSLTFPWPGPGYVKDLEVIGFDYGIFSGSNQYSMVFEKIRLKGQRKAGVKDKMQMLRFMDVSSENTVPAFELGDRGNITILNAKLNGGSSGTDAITGGGDIFLQNVSASGYDSVVKDMGKQVETYASRGEARFGSAESKALFLKHENPPTIDPGPVNEWVCVNAFEGNALEDKLQNAIDSGAKTIYLNEDEIIKLSKTIVVRKNIECIMGMGAPVMAGKNFKDSDTPAFLIEEGSGKPLLIERLPDSYGAQKWMFEIAAKRTVHFRNMAVAGMRNSIQGGKVFLDDIVGQRPNNFEFSGKDVFARQWNPECYNGTNILLRKSNAWIFGLKTEYGHTVVDLDEGARATIYGLFSYHTGKDPWFVIGDGELTLTNPSAAEKGYQTWFKILGKDYSKVPGTVLIGK